MQQQQPQQQQQQGWLLASALFKKRGWKCLSYVKQKSWNKTKEIKNVTLFLSNHFASDFYCCRYTFECAVNWEWWPIFVIINSMYLKMYCIAIAVYVTACKKQRALPKLQIQFLRKKCWSKDKTNFTFLK